MLLNQMVPAISFCIVLMCLKGGCHLHHLLNCYHHFISLSPVSPEIYDTSLTTEEKRFQTRYEKGFDITTDCRYNQWLQKNFSEAISEPYQLQFSLNPENWSLHLEEALEQGVDECETNLISSKRLIKYTTPGPLSKARSISSTSSSSIYRCQEETWWSKGSH